MATVKLPNGGTAGLANFEKGDDYVEVELFAGSHPEVITRPYPVASGIAIPANSVVGLTAGNLVMAEQDGLPLAIGITVSEVASNATAQSVAVYVGGNFNPDALNWHASFTTDAQKKVAFDGAPSPTSILLTKTFG